MNSRFYELERRCLEYNRKKNMKSLALGASVGVFLVLIAFFAGAFDDSHEFSKNDIEIISPSEELEESDDTYMTQSSDEIMSEELGEEVLEHGANDEELEDDLIKEPVIKVQRLEKVEEAVEEKIIQVKKELITEKKTLFLAPQISLDIFKKKDSKKIINKEVDKKVKDLVETFENVDNPISIKESEFISSPNIESAISISEYYYNKNDYKKSLKWAIEASKIDAKASKPWVMYARAKAKSGDTKIAIKALQTYLSEYYSDEASNLLDELKGRK